MIHESRGMFRGRKLSHNKIHESRGLFTVTQIHSKVIPTKERKSTQRTVIPHVSEVHFLKWHAHLLFPELGALFLTFLKMPRLHQYP